jgi:plastocyanin
VRKPTALIGALLLTAGLAACGDDSSDSAEAPAEGTETTTAPADGGEMGAPADGETVTVEIGDFVYEPTPIEISVGQSVMWINVHNQAHTATGNGDQRWDTGNLAPDATSEPVLFEEPGSFAYICALHPFMEGTVEVSA